MEDYLEAIFHVAAEKGAARAKDISKRMKVNSSSVTGALRALADRGLVNYAPYDIVTLTAKGTRMAEDVIRRHVARYALERIPEPQAGQALARQLRKLSGNLKIGVISSLGTRGQAAAGLLRPLLKDSDDAVARAAAVALGCIGSVEADKALASAMPRPALVPVCLTIIK